VFQNSNLENIITGVGWEGKSICTLVLKANTDVFDTAWSSSQSTANIYFAEYANSNAAGTRVSWAKALSSAAVITTILPTYSSWVDSAYLGLSAP
jgi:pectinesterase